MIEWNIGRGKGLGPAPFLVAGILNVTPDSFHDGGRYVALTDALAQARRLAEAGVSMIDIGGESTRPGSARVSSREEMDRVLPIVRALVKEFAACPGAPVVSVDTYKAEVAAAALEVGADIVNDVSACEFDPGLLDVLSQFQPGYVLMHSLGRPETMQNDPRYTDVVDEIISFFDKKLQILVKAGLPENRVVLDPGIGFGKLLEHNIAILRRVREFFCLGRPLYMGLSNKSLWQGLLGLPSGQRETATQVATALLYAQGVRIHRVHDAARTMQSLQLARALEA